MEPSDPSFPHDVPSTAAPSAAAAMAMNCMCVVVPTPQMPWSDVLLAEAQLQDPERWDGMS